MPQPRKELHWSNRKPRKSKPVDLVILAGLLLVMGLIPVLHKKNIAVHWAIAAALALLGTEAFLLFRRAQGQVRWLWLAAALLAALALVLLIAFSLLSI